jgi:hypothetical protein
MLLPGTIFHGVSGTDCKLIILLAKKKQLLKAVVSDEIMFNVSSNKNKNTFDQNRIYTALHHGLNS